MTQSALVLIKDPPEGPIFPRDLDDVAVGIGPVDLSGRPLEGEAVRWPQAETQDDLLPFAIRTQALALSK